MALDILISTSQLYAEMNNLNVSEDERDILNIPTFYEKMFKEKGHEICYLKMAVNNNE